MRPLITALLSLYMGASLIGCASNQGESSVAGSTCTVSDNLLQAPDFGFNDEGKRVWSSAQHSSTPSFVSGFENGVLTIEQKGTEPWFMVRQQVRFPDMQGSTLRFSAETKGDISVEPKLHGFEHKAGLHYSFRGVGRGSPTFTADQTPNTGQWDWQEMSVEFEVPESATSLRVGFLHQGGGTLQARNPVLVRVDCPNK